MTEEKDEKEITNKITITVASGLMSKETKPMKHGKRYDELTKEITNENLANAKDNAMIRYENIKIGFKVKITSGLRNLLSKLELSIINEKI